MNKEINYQEAAKIYNEVWNAVETINEIDNLKDATDTLKRITSNTIRRLLDTCGVYYGLYEDYHDELYPIEVDVKKLEKEIGKITEISDYKETLRRKPKIKKTTNEIETRERIARRNMSSIKERILHLLQKISEGNPIKLAS